MQFTPDQVEPAPGKFFIRMTPIAETTEGGLHLPKMVDAKGRPTTSMPQTATATIVSSGGPVGQSPDPAFGPEDKVILAVMPATVTMEGAEYGFVDFHHCLARIK